MLILTRPAPGDQRRGEQDQGLDPATVRAHIRAAFVTNSREIAPVGQIDDLSLPVDGTLFAALTEAYESAGRDPI